MVGGQKTIGGDCQRFVGDAEETEDAADEAVWNVAIARWA